MMRAESRLFDFMYSMAHMTPNFSRTSSAWSMMFSALIFAS